MTKISRYIKSLQKISFPVMAISILMIFLLIFSQMVMAVHAYSKILLKNNKTQEAGILAFSLVKKQEVQKENSVKTAKNVNKIKAEEIYISTMTDYLIKPVSGGVTTSVFGDVIDRTQGHKGHDWAVNTGTQVAAAAKGTVTRAYYSESYGYNVVVNHLNGLQTRYAHLSELMVHVNEKVEQGDIIGLSGNTGNSTGPHLHFEVILNGKNLNPVLFIK